MGLYSTTIGPFLIGVFLNTFLYGLVTYQFAVYHQTKFNDSLAIRCMVLFLFILDTFHSASLMYLAWDYTVANYDNPAALALADWPHAFTPLCTALAALVTQLYLGIRIWRLTGSKILYSVVTLLAVLSFVFGMVASIRAWNIRVLSEFGRLGPIPLAWLPTQAVADIVITVTLIIIFSRSRTGFRKTDTILNRFIRASIQTGLFAVIFAIADLITSTAFLRTNLFVVFSFPLGRIYTNALMDTLLARQLFMVKDSTGNLQRTVLDSVFTGPMPIDSQALSWDDVGSQRLGGV